MGYYNDEKKLTFDEAEQLVHRYVRRNHETTTTISAKSLMRKYDIEDSRHNTIRIAQMLSENLEVYSERSRKRTLYELP